MRVVHRVRAPTSIRIDEVHARGLDFDEDLAVNCRFCLVALAALTICYPFARWAGTRHAIVSFDGRSAQTCLFASMSVPGTSLTPIGGYRDCHWMGDEVGIVETDYFRELSTLHQAITLLDERISATVQQGSRVAGDVDEFGEVGVEGELLHLPRLSAILSEGNIGLASMRPIREVLVGRMHEVYKCFADMEFETLHELREDSALGGPVEQCAFAVTAVLDSFASQFEEQVDRNNFTVEFLLEFSDELGLSDQAKGDQEPFVDTGVARLSEGLGKPSNGIRVGDDEIRIADEVQVHTGFINQIARVAGDLISETLSAESSRAIEQEIFSVSEDREYAYGEAIFLSKVTEGEVRL